MAEYYSDMEYDEDLEEEDQQEANIIMDMIDEDDHFNKFQAFKFEIEDRSPEFHFLTWIPTGVLMDRIENYSFREFRSEPFPPDNVIDIMAQFVEICLGKEQELINDPMDLASLYCQLSSN